MRTYAQKHQQSQQGKSGDLVRPSAAARSHEVHPILHLQRTIGNQAVLRMLQTHAKEPDVGLAPAASPRFRRDFSQIPIHPTAAGAIQAKLAINKPGDQYEQEADRVSEQVMRMPEPQLQQHACPYGGGCPKCQTGQLAQEHDRLQTEHVGSGGLEQIAVPPIIAEALSSPGQPLDLATRGFMEPRFGHDFSRVRVHADPGAAGSAESINARAYTVGHHVVFGIGEYRPGTAGGRRLLAHELAHVAQQDAWVPLREAVLQRDDKAPASVPTENPKVTALKAELVTTYGFSAVADSTGAKWTVPELEKMKRALARIPAAERGAIRGVELRRVVKTSQFNAIASGLFHQEIAPGTGIRQDRIEIANDSFAHDVDYDAGGAHTAFGGQVVQGAPSEGDLSHEVGHAVESFQRRTAEETQVKAGLARTAASKDLQSATAAYRQAIPTPINVPAPGNAKETAYRAAILNARDRLAAITRVIDQIPETPTATQSKRGATNVKSALDTAKTAINARNTVRAALPAGSTFAMADAEAAQDTWLAAAVVAVPAFEAHAKAQEDVEKANDAPATQITIRVSSGRRVQMTRRLAEFVALIEVNRIDIPNSTLGNHVTTNWPNNPEEAYAELYSLSVTAPEGLRKFDRTSAVATYFTSPVGLKGSQNAQAASWIASHQ